LPKNFRRRLRAIADERFGCASGLLGVALDANEVRAELDRGLVSDVNMSVLCTPPTDHRKKKARRRFTLWGTELCAVRFFWELNVRQAEMN
jgi:hypothetical protein